MTVTPPLFREVMGTFATGVTVVTTSGESGTPYGVTVNSFTSVSLRPPLILVCLDNRLSGLGHFRAGARFAVNILGEDQREISDRFATRGSDRSQGIDKSSPGATPFIPNALARLECRLSECHAGGDHTILLAEVEAVHLAPDAHLRGPLLYHRGRYRTLATKPEKG